MRYGSISIFLVLFILLQSGVALSQTPNEKLISFLLNAEHELIEEGIPFLKPSPGDSDRAIDIEVTVSYGSADKGNLYSNYSYNDDHQLIYQCVQSSPKAEEMHCWSYVYNGQSLPQEMEFGSSIERESIHSQGFLVNDDFVHLINHKTNDTLMFSNKEHVAFGETISFEEASMVLSSKSKGEVKKGALQYNFTLGPDFQIISFSKLDSSTSASEEIWTINYNTQGLISNATKHNSAGKLLENWRVTYDSNKRITQQFEMVNKIKLEYTYQETY